jgi:hypothetical protein
MIEHTPNDVHSVSKSANSTITRVGTENFEGGLHGSDDDTMNCSCTTMAGDMIKRALAYRPTSFKCLDVRDGTFSGEERNDSRTKEVISIDEGLSGIVMKLDHYHACRDAWTAPARVEWIFKGFYNE